MVKLKNRFKPVWKSFRKDLSMVRANPQRNFLIKLWSGAGIHSHQISRWPSHFQKSEAWMDPSSLLFLLILRCNLGWWIRVGIGTFPPSLLGPMVTSFILSRHFHRFILLRTDIYTFVCFVNWSSLPRGKERLWVQILVFFTRTFHSNLFGLKGLKHKSTNTEISWALALLLETNFVVQCEWIYSYLILKLYTCFAFLIVLFAV